LKFPEIVYIILIMKIRKEEDGFELWSVDGDGGVWDWIRKNGDERMKSLWGDDEVFESVSLDELVDDVNEVYKEKRLRERNISDWEVSDWVDKDGGECIERYCEIMDE
jgi:hypothetical protein